MSAGDQPPCGVCVVSMKGFQYGHTEACQCGGIWQLWRHDKFRDQGIGARSLDLKWKTRGQR